MRKDTLVEEVAKATHTPFNNRYWMSPCSIKKYFIDMYKEAID